MGPQRIDLAADIVIKTKLNWNYLGFNGCSVSHTVIEPTIRSPPKQCMLADVKKIVLDDISVVAM